MWERWLRGVRLSISNLKAINDQTAGVYLDILCYVEKIYFHPQKLFFFICVERVLNVDVVNEIIENKIAFQNITNSQIRILCFEKRCQREYELENVFSIWPKKSD